MPEKDDFFKGKCPKFCPNSWKISTLLNENPLKMSEFLKNKYFFNEISPSSILFPKDDDFLKGKCASFGWNFEK
jgi:hypothetical protein